MENKSHDDNHLKSRVITIISTRPEIIRLSLIIKKLDSLLGDNHILIHTKQNFTYELNNQFFEDLDIRKPNFELNQHKLTGYEFGGSCMIEISKILSLYNPKNDKILILGDVNGAFYSSYVAKRMGFKIYHLEAGNRCFDEIVPEEINRKSIDNFSYKLLTYTQRSRENLIRENYSLKDIIVVGNPIFEVVNEFTSIYNSHTNKRKNHIIATFHRDENITNIEILSHFINQLNLIVKSEDIKIYLSMHPKLEDLIKKNKDSLNSFDENIILSKPFKFTEFLKFQSTAKCVITDSGTVPEECSMFNTPCILVRNSTERPELLEVNQMIVSKAENIFDSYKAIEKLKFENVPEDYNKKTSEIVSKILIGDL